MTSTYLEIAVLLMLSEWPVVVSARRPRSRRWGRRDQGPAPAAILGAGAS